MSDPLAQISLKNPWHLLATGFGSGLSPLVPGTMGTLAAVPFFLLLAQLPISVYLVIVVVGFALGVKLCAVTSHDMGVHDHGAIVWDEFIGFWLTMTVMPLCHIPLSEWQWIVTGFVLFRLFDMIKPWPISWLDRHVHGGFGIMVDDMIAGVMAGLALYLVGFYAGWLN
ncbi:phosphatidylglycerophosphatase A [Vibrio sp. SM6]|uniref:Phosphatidylglycerophosphatase A n=1 Tax=Vibrio agarilyticus TaxID=2726741 RepID=A0A7X8TSQ8_9VIBR|nr:phosphatidylglycerophosphatase A [Vibrio agarilyticus]NLS14136.1 phosphatidylglycerophosphatase A [Vibrio agarilyticus]